MQLSSITNFLDSMFSSIEDAHLKKNKEAINPISPEQLKINIESDKQVLKNMQNALVDVASESRRPELDLVMPEDGTGTKRTEVFNPPPRSHPYEYRQDFKNRLATMENSVHSGWDASTKKWHPHKSHELGRDTIAYGHKLTDEEIKSGKIHGVDYTNGLTEEQAQTMLDTDITLHKEKLIREMNKYKPSGKTFNDLPDLGKELLTEIVYNIGTAKQHSGSTTSDKWGWNKLVKEVIKPNPSKEVLMKEVRRKGVGEERYKEIEKLIDYYLKGE